MTSKVINKKLCDAKRLVAPLICLGLTAITLLFGDELKKSIYRGFVFSFTTVIPALFPFFILSDVWSAMFIPDKKGKLSLAFEKIFRINSSALPAFICGLICGFPIGVKSASSLLSENKITKEEFERLSGFANNPSLAFVIFGVGAGILGSVKYGVLLYLCVVFSAILTGIVFRCKKYKSEETYNNIGQKFDLVNSIKSAGIASINISSYIVFFSGIIGLISSLVKSQRIVALASTLLEVANAARLLSLCPSFDLYAKLSLTAFTIGFSGLSVHMQALSFFPQKANIIKYLTMKTIQGIFSFAIMLVFLIFI